MRRRPIVTIDGPAGAGKSTTARALARRLGFVYLDTGAIYRAAALAASRDPELRRRLAAAADPQRLDEETGAALGGLARTLDLRFDGGGRRVLLGGEDVSEAIRTAEVSELASRIAAVPAVRAGVLDLQRRLAAGGGVVAEGRDLGTVVFPDAEVKIYLTADLESRSRRRAAEQAQRGEAADLARVRAEIQGRDRRDTGRATAPLRPAPDAVRLDTSDLGVEEVVDRLEQIVSRRLRA